MSFRHRLPSFNPIQAASEDAKEAERSNRRRTTALNVAQIIVLLLLAAFLAIGDVVTYVLGACSGTVGSQLAVFTTSIPWIVLLLIAAIVIYILKPWRILRKEDEAAPSMAAIDFSAQDKAESELKRTKFQKFIVGYGLLGAVAVLAILMAIGLAVQGGAPKAILAGAACHAIVPAHVHHNHSHKPKPVVTPQPTATPTPSAKATPTPKPTVTPAPTPVATATPTPTPSGGGVPTSYRKPKATPTATPSARPTPTPIAKATPPELTAESPTETTGTPDLLTASGMKPGQFGEFITSKRQIVGACQAGASGSCAIAVNSSAPATITYTVTDETTQLTSNQVSVSWGSTPAPTPTPTPTPTPAPTTQTVSLVTANPTPFDGTVNLQGQGQTDTLTATASPSLNGGEYLVIVDDSTGAEMGSCGVGINPCTVVVQTQPAGKRPYSAEIVDNGNVTHTSQTQVVNWLPLPVISSGLPGSPVAGQTYTVSANVPQLPQGDSLKIAVVAMAPPPTGTVTLGQKTCSTGSCSVVIAIPTGESSTTEYVETTQILNSSGSMIAAGIPAIAGYGAPTTSSTITLSAAQTSLDTGAGDALTISSTQSGYVVILDLATGNYAGQGGCNLPSGGGVCTLEVTSLTPGSYEYAALNQFSNQESAPVTVVFTKPANPSSVTSTDGPVSLSLSASNVLPAAGQTVTITATATGLPGGDSIAISGGTKNQTCSAGTSTCSLSFVDEGQQVVTATIQDATYPVLAELDITWPTTAASVSFTASATSGSASSPVTLTGTATPFVTGDTITIMQMESNGDGGLAQVGTLASCTNSSCTVKVGDNQFGSTTFEMVAKDQYGNQLVVNNPTVTVTFPAQDLTLKASISGYTVTYSVTGASLPYQAGLPNFAYLTTEIGGVTTDLAQCTVDSSGDCSGTYTVNSPPSSSALALQAQDMQTQVMSNTVNLTANSNLAIGVYPTSFSTNQTASVTVLNMLPNESAYVWSGSQVVGECNSASQNSCVVKISEQAAGTYKISASTSTTSATTNGSNVVSVSVTVPTPTWSLATANASAVYGEGVDEALIATYQNGTTTPTVYFHTATGSSVGTCSVQGTSNPSCAITLGSTVGGTVTYDLESSSTFSSATSAILATTTIDWVSSPTGTWSATPASTSEVVGNSDMVDVVNTNGTAASVISLVNATSGSTRMSGVIIGGPSLQTMIPATSPTETGTVHYKIVGDGVTLATFSTDWTSSATQSQTITFISTPPSNPTVGETYTPTATASSGLQVTLTIDSSSSSICSMSSAGVVTFATAGSCIIDANQSGNSTYAPAPQVQQTMDVASDSTTAPTLSVSSANPSTGGTVTFRISGATTGIYQLYGSTSSSSSFSSNFGNTMDAGTCGVPSGGTSCSISYSTTDTGTIYYEVAPQSPGSVSNIVSVTWG